MGLESLRKTAQDYGLSSKGGPAELKKRLKAHFTDQADAAAAKALVGTLEIDQPESGGTVGDDLDEPEEGDAPR